MNRPVSLLIAALVLAAVAAYYFQVDRPAQEHKEAQNEKDVFLDIPRDRVDTVEIQRGGDTIRLARDAQRRWWLRAPEVAPARGDVVEDLLYQATTPGVLRRLTVDAKGRGELGLDTPAATLHLTGEGIDVTVEVGIDAPTLKGRYYLGRSDGDEVIITTSPLRKTLQKPVEELRRRRIFEVPRWRAVTVEKGEGVAMVTASSTRLTRSSAARSNTMTPSVSANRLQRPVKALPTRTLGPEHASAMTAAASSSGTSPSSRRAIVRMS